MRVKIMNEAMNEDGRIIMPSWFTGANRDPIELRSSDQPRKPLFKIMYEQDPKTKEFNTMNIVKGTKSVAKIKFKSVEDAYDAQNVILHHLGNPKDYYTPRWDPVITDDNMSKAIRKTANELNGEVQF